jgi:hypothetical protein
MPKRCRTCHQTVPETPVREDQVTVFRFKNGSTVVDASCKCFGAPFRLHSNANCPLLRRQRATP